MLITAPIRAADRPPAAAVASAHPLATAAGLEILHAGGNAFDAAVAVSAALAVVEPYFSGLGGGGFWLLHRARDGREIVIDGRERAPQAARADMYLDAHGAIIPNRSLDGPLAAAIPGEPAALAHLAAHYGRLPLARSLVPAIRYAREGYKINERYAHLAQSRRDALNAAPTAAQQFLINGAPPAPGTQLRQPALAATLDTLAKRGAAGFYRGELAARLVAGVRAAGGNWTRADLANYKIIERAPLHGDYRGLRITTVAPPSSGGVVLLEMLNMLSGYDLARLDVLTRTHVEIEVMRRTYRDRAAYLGDPDFVAMPLPMLLSRDYAAGLRASIRLDRATPSASLPGAVDAEPAGHDTTHFSIIDREGNWVAATLSINYPFGSGFVAPGTGVLLNDEMDDFSAKPGVPNAYGLVGAQANAIAPGKRPLSSMTPTFVSGQHGVAILGTPGGSRIISMVLLGVLDVAAGKSAQQCVAEPRFHHQFLPDVIEYEPNAFDTATVAGLEKLGHHLKALTEPYGNMQMVYWNKKLNRVTATSDPRGSGSAQVDRSN
ncbi:MAG: gamma-glutamyltransferase [Gammaproteobacteria bacterium]